jgi:tRNA(Ile)-lysidine synthase
VQISELHPALASRLLARAAKTAGGPDAVPSYEQVEKALAMARSPRQRWSIGFPAGVTVAGRNRVLRVGLIPADRGRLRAVQLPVPGTLDFDGWRITARSGTRSPAEPGDQVLLLDAAVIRGNLTVRSRRDGDRMRPLGLGGTKKVQDILVDRKVPVETRDQLPLVCDDAGVLWIPEQCIDERATVRSEAAAIIQLTARRLIGSGGAATIKTRARGSRARKG